MRAKLTVTALAALSPAAFGHHSDAGVDMTTVMEFDGTVTSYNWRNPHVYFNVVRTEAPTAGACSKPTLRCCAFAREEETGWSDKAELSPGEQVETILWGPGLRGPTSYFDSLD